MTMFHYKSFIGSIEVDPQQKCLHGKLLYSNDLITYEAETVVELEAEFKAAVDDYLLTCHKLNREPLKPFKGSLNIRIGARLHREAALHAAIDGISLNDYIKTAVQSQIQQESDRV
ncbi:type II toxin-antitoxin system HicB family antitoxin [soil metagenome]